jgi:capsular exopolysaccharide synthesis family protein
MVTMEQELTALELAWNNDGLPLPADPRASLDRACRIIWRYRWRFLLVFTPILLIGLGYLLVAPERYTAHATLMVGIRQPELLTPEQAREPTRSEPDIDGAIELIRSQPALAHVVGALELDHRPEFQSLVHPGEFAVLTGFRRLVATWFGHADGFERPQHDPSALLTSRLRKDVKVERVGRSALLDVAYSSTDPSLAASVVNNLASFSAGDESFLAHLPLAERSGFQIVKTSIVSSALPPHEPSSPNTVVILASAVLCAFAAALSAVLLEEYRAQQTVLSAEQVTRHRLRSLGLIPSNPAIGGRRGSGVATVAARQGRAFGDSVTSLHAAISTLSAGHGPGCMVLLFTSALQAEGKSTTAAALGASMAASGMRVLLIDADLRSPTLHRTFKLDLMPGLSGCIAPSIHPANLIQHDAVTGVDLLAAGEFHHGALPVLGSARLRNMIESWRTEYDVILLDAPPVLAVGDARLLAQVADYTVIVARWGKTRWNALNHAIRLLTEGGARVAGVVVSRVNVKQLATYDYADARIYGPGYGSQIQVRGN